MQPRAPGRVPPPLQIHCDVLCLFLKLVIVETFLGSTQAKIRVVRTFLISKISLLSAAPTLILTIDIQVNVYVEVKRLALRIGSSLKLFKESRLE